MMLFIFGLIIGSIGGMIMMAMFLSGKNRESTFDQDTATKRSRCPSNSNK